MRALSALLAFALLSSVCLACGSQGQSTDSAARTSLPTSTEDHKGVKTVRGVGPEADEDADGDHDFYTSTGDYGRAAIEQDQRSVTAVANGASSTLEVEARSTRPDADGDYDVHQAILSFGHSATPVEQHAVTTAVKHYYTAAAAGDGAKACSLLAPSLAKTLARDYGHTHYLAGGDCAMVLSKLFERLHGELMVDRHTIVVLPARMKGDLGVALLSWNDSSREGQIVLRHEHGAWKLDALIDGPRPVDGEGH
jgi:hypothetical protein